MAAMRQHSRLWSRVAGSTVNTPNTDAVRTTTFKCRGEIVARLGSKPKGLVPKLMACRSVRWLSLCVEREKLRAVEPVAIDQLTRSV